MKQYFNEAKEWKIAFLNKSYAKRTVTRFLKADLVHNSSQTDMGHDVLPFSNSFTSHLTAIVSLITSSSETAINCY